MTVLSQDKKIIFTGKDFSLEKAFGMKDKKFAIVGYTKNYAAKTLALYSNEKMALDAMQQLFDAIDNGDNTFEFSEEV